MRVIHEITQADPALASAKTDAWIYRTRVENDGDCPIRVIWFEYYYAGEEGEWHGINVRNRPLRTPDFVEWYGDSDEEGALNEGWIAPGKSAVCDPNWHMAFPPCFHKAKWSYLAVDANGNDYLAEAVVEEQVVKLHQPKGD